MAPTRADVSRFLGESPLRAAALGVSVVVLVTTLLGLYPLLTATTAARTDAYLLAAVGVAAGGGVLLSIIAVMRSVLEFVVYVSEDS